MSRRIALVIDPWDFPFNGAVVSTRRFVQALENQYDFKLFSTPEDAFHADQRMVQFKRISLPGFNSILDEMKVPLGMPNRKRMLDALSGCRLLHVQFPFFLGFSAISVARRLKIPVLCTFHVQPENLLYNLGIRSRWLARLVYKFFVVAFYNRADLVIAPSEFAAGILRRHGLKKPIKVISNGVPECFLNVKHREARPGGVFQILSVGRLAREKRQEIILHAVARSRYKASIKLHMVGNGPMKNALKTLAGRLGLKVVIDSVSDASLLSLYASADLFIHAGEIELEGMSVVEAMAAGNTVVVSDSADSATAGLVSNKQALFKNGDADDLAVKIDYWISHTDERLSEAGSNREWATNRSHDVSAMALAAVYDELLAFESRQSQGETQLE